MKLRIDIEKKLGDFSLKVNTEISGERVGIFGASGSGKSTLTHLIAGLIKPDAGEIYLDDTCLFSSRKKIDLSPEKRRISIVFQQATLFPHLGVKQNLLYGYKRCRPAERRIEPEAIIGVLNLGHLVGRGVNKLSGGEKQRVALGRAVLANPRLLVMDEPLSALDDSLRYQIIPYLRSVSAEFGIPCLFISHSITEMQLMTERVLVVKNGRLSGISTPDQLARAGMASNPKGYLNLLRLNGAKEQDGLFHCPWGSSELIISDGKTGEESLFELSSRDIILFKQHPEAISARNLLECTVTELFDSDGRKGVVLQSGGKTLVAEIVRVAAEELVITQGSTLFAAIKASAFRRLG
ncbi:molybdenum ABC transporter ATP-binding protein [Chlorobaculum limnaeum]|uniref:Molybdenum ABC transporter ATP-binding protein n=1 Tax=Chlorobaculum limnaeum TaxID=274537 RepID=A0A1D8D924_CHLLM|nr:molybdenum ABC transporter ATP-binding protein [Chlorobaculum limnaeum]AOS84279.1 molybdenum ABC transporter ATP-binding protein [Chlorobaculum limnaeum]